MTKPLEQLSAEIDALDDIIRNGIEQLADVLHGRVTVRLKVAIDHERELSFGKYRTGWCFIYKDAGGYSPLLTRNREERLEMIEGGHLERLVDTAPQQLAEMAPPRRAAIARLEDMIERARSAQGAL